MLAWLKLHSFDTESQIRLVVSAETLWWRYGGAQGYSNRADAHYYAAQDLTL